MSSIVLFKPVAAAYVDMLTADFDARPYPASPHEMSAAERGGVSSVVILGSQGMSAAEMDRFPALRHIACVGTGHENVDLDAAAARGIVVTNGASTNAEAVADHAFGLLIAAVRKIPQFDRHVRAGGWRDDIPVQPALYGKKIGLAGMGHIGAGVARRAAGFGMKVHYYARSEKPFPGAIFVPSLPALAEAVDFMVVSLPGGAETFHIVDRDVLDRLGRGGYLVSVGRGSVVDTQALVAALREERIAGAGLDVYEDEPHVPEALRALDNVVLTPHVAGVAVEALEAAAELLRQNILAVREGRPAKTAVRARSYQVDQT